MKMKFLSGFSALLLVSGLSACASPGDEARYQQSQTFQQMNTTTPDFTAQSTAAATPAPAGKQIDTATFGAGCFWCTEAQFQQLEGVTKVESGYTGGTVANPTYKQVCTGTTGHAEVTRVYFDPTRISFEELLAAFWQTHDPTQLNRQGNDVGTQYRSAIFYHNSEQKRLSEEYKKKLNDENAFGKAIVTEISPATAFYKAEDYHQNYYNNNSNEGYCQFVVRPKLDKFKKVFKDKLKTP